MMQMIADKTYKIQELRKNLEFDYDYLVNEYKKKMDEIFSSIESQGDNISKTINQLFQNRLNDENQKLAKKRKKVQNYLINEENAFSNEISGLTSSIFLINQLLQEQIDVMNRDTTISDIHNKIEEIHNETHKQKINIEEENQKKIEKLYKDNAKQLESMVQHFEKVKRDLYLSYEIDNRNNPTYNLPIFDDLLKDKKKLVNHINEMKNEALNLKTAFIQSLSELKINLSQIFQQINTFNSESREEEKQFKDGINKKNNEYAEEIIYLNENLKALAQAHKKELDQIEDEKNQFNSQKEKDIDNISLKMNKKISDINQHLENERKNQINMLNEKKENISQIENKINEDIKKLGESKVEKINTYQQEIETITQSTLKNKEIFKEQKLNENQRFKSLSDQENIEFERRRLDLQTSLKNAKEIEQKIQEYLKEKENLENQFKSINDAFILAAQSFEENNDNISDDDYKQLLLQLEEIYKKQQSEFLNQSNSITNDFDIKEKNLQKNLNKKYEESIKEINQSFEGKDDNVTKIQQYEKLYNDLNKELLNYEELPQLTRVENDKEIDELTNKQELLKKSIEHEKESMIIQYQKDFKLCQDNLPKIIDSFPDLVEKYDHEIKIIKKENKKQLKTFNNEIQEKKKTLKNLKELKIPKKELENDDKVKAAKAALNDIIQKSNEKIEIQESQSKKIFSLLESQIQSANMKNQSSINHENKQQEIDHKRFHELFYSHIDKRKLKKKQFEEMKDEIQKQYELDLIEKKTQHELKIQQLNQAILTEKTQLKSHTDISIDKINSEFEILILENQEKYNNEIKQLITKKDLTKKQTEQEISAAKEKLNTIITQVKEKPMGEEEKITIDQLTLSLEEVTENLKAVGKEFLDFREGLAVRDNEFNARFGRAPQISFDIKNSKQRSSSVFSKRKPLPPLAPYSL